MKEVSQVDFDIRAWALGINECIRGRTNALIQTVTLTANSATTVITNVKIGKYSSLFFSPKTANAAAALANVYVSSVAKGTATLTHTNNAQVDRTFDILVKTAEAP